MVRTPNHGLTQNQNYPTQMLLNSRTQDVDRSQSVAPFIPQINLDLNHSPQNRMSHTPGPNVLQYAPQQPQTYALTQNYSDRTLQNNGRPNVTGSSTISYMPQSSWSQNHSQNQQNMGSQNHMPQVRLIF